MGHKKEKEQQTTPTHVSNYIIIWTL